jgi:hypothetical protein
MVSYGDQDSQLGDRRRKCEFASPEAKSRVQVGVKTLMEEVKYASCIFSHEL